MDNNASTPTTGGAWLRALAGPVLLVLSLGTVHYVMTVPKSDMIARKKKGKKDKKKAKKGVTKPGKRYPVFDKWKAEKRDDGFARTHEPVMKFAYDLAHAAVFEGEKKTPKSFLRSTECHRWHCQYKVCGERRDLSDVVRVLKQLEHEDDELFDAFETLTRDDSKGDHCSRVVVRFSRPSPEIKGIRVEKRSLARVHRAREARHRSEEKSRQRREKKAAQKVGAAKKPPNEDLAPKVAQEPKKKP